MSPDRFLIGDEIARGGIGAVHLARDTHLGRDVAVKVLRPKFVGTVSERRFWDEARIMGRLQHPGVPPVHDLGTLPDGRPFLAMKLIEGRTLAELIDAGERPVAVFEAVCQAVAYAHAHDIIHRDLKPANIMVGAFGEAQVMDWGLAKVLTAVSREAESSEPSADPLATTAESEAHRTDGLETQAGDILGTPAFMPPEQAGGELAKIDRRSDVFGLGAVLCSLLTGRPPYIGGDARSTRLMAVRGELADALARLDACGADPGLVSLCKRCLAVKPEDRPADALAVATEVAGLRQAAEDRARRAEQEYAAGRARRRWGLVAIGVLLLGVAGTGIGFIRADRQRRAAEANEATAKRERDAASAARKRARDVLDAMTSTETQSAVLGQRTISPEQRAFLTRALDFYKELAAAGGNDKDSRIDRANAAYRLSRFHADLGDLATCETVLRTAIDGYAALAADFPTEPDHRVRLAAAINDQAVRAVDTGRFGEAEVLHRRALGLRREALAEFIDSRVDRLDVANSHNNLGICLRQLNRENEAEAEYRAAIALYDLPDVGLSLRPERLATLGGLYSNLGGLLYDTDRAAESLSWFDRAEVSLTQAVVADLRDRTGREFLANTLGHKALALTSLGRYFTAYATNRRRLDAVAALTADYPSRPEYRVMYAVCCRDLGYVINTAGFPANSLAWYDKAAARLESEQASSLLARDGLRHTLAGRAYARSKLGQFDKSVADYDRALNHFPADIGLARARAGALERWGDELAKTDVGRSEENYRAAIVAWERLIADSPNDQNSHLSNFQCLQNLAALLKGKGRSADLVATLRTMVTATERAVAALPDFPDAKGWLGGSYCNLAHELPDGEALAWYDRAVATLEPLVAARTGPKFAVPFLRNSLKGRAQARDRVGHHAAAADYRRLIDLAPPAERPAARLAWVRALARAGLLP